MDTAQRVMLYHVLEDHHDSRWQKNTKENVYTVLKTQKYDECYKSYLIYSNFIVIVTSVVRSTIAIQKNLRKW